MGSEQPREAASRSTGKLSLELRAVREAAGLSLAELARRTHYSKSLLGHLETGHRSVLPEHVAAYERAMGVRVADPSHRADTTDVELVGSAVDVVTTIGLRHGGRATLELAAAQRSWVLGVFARARNEAVQAALASELARLSGRLAWCRSVAGHVKARADFGAALDLARNRTVRTTVLIDLAAHEVRTGSPGEAIAIVAGLPLSHPAQAFSAYGVRAHAHAVLGEAEESLRYLGLSEEAWASVERTDVPPILGPFVSGHDGHAHHAAGKVLHELARRGRPSALPEAVRRLELAIATFGPERARAVERCRKRLHELQQE